MDHPMELRVGPKCLRWLQALEPTKLEPLELRQLAKIGHKLTGEDSISTTVVLIAEDGKMEKHMGTEFAPDPRDRVLTLEAGTTDLKFLACTPGQAVRPTKDNGRTENVMGLVWRHVAVGSTEGNGRKVLRVVTELDNRLRRPPGTRAPGLADSTMDMDRKHTPIVGLIRANGTGG
ncbi:uncharacterized protein LOC105685562 [Athalia rosae]|uniref:uncharacterized protein LOC105685562 n=1 Tax=Athalia rosae TaxID=37344 RepID=UPI0020349779|nr:uncharacterized protein LOC105685562 [Athalia rosae]